jgi:two-component system sensor histidine kinase/response regulator
MTAFVNPLHRPSGTFVFAVIITSIVATVLVAMQTAPFALEQIRWPATATVLLILLVAWLLLRLNPWLRQVGENQALLHSVIDTALDGIVAIDTRGLIREFNPAATRIFSYAREEVIGRNVSLLMPQPMRGGHDGHLQRYLQTGESRIVGSGHRELQGQRKNGEIFPLEIAINAAKIEQESLFIAIVRDITQRNQAEQALIHNKLRLKEAQRIAKVGSWELDIENNHLVWSDEIYRIFEIDPAQFGASYEAFLDTVHPDDRDRVNQAYTDSLTHRCPYAIDHRLLMGDGRIKVVRETCESDFDTDNKPLRSMGTVQDITELHQTRQALDLQHQQLEIIRRAQAGFIAGGDPVEFFDGLVQSALDLTQSQYGFIGETMQDAQGERYLKFHALKGFMGQNQQYDEFYDQYAPKGLEFRNLDNVFGKVILSGETVISNDPLNDSRSGSLPQGHPPLSAFLGIPIKRGSQLLGMVGVANRHGGYSEAMLQCLQPILGTCAQLFDALNKERERQRAASEFKRAASFMSGIIHNMPLGILVEDEAGVIHAVNQVYCDMFGKDQLPLMLEGSDCAQEFEANQTQFADPEAFMTWRQTCLSHSDTVTGKELVLSDGRVFQQGCVPIFVEDEHGELHRNHIWNFRDISEPTHMLALLEQQGAHVEQMRQFVEKTLDTLTASVCVLDETGCIIYVNQAWRDFGRRNGYLAADSGLGMNYLNICDQASENPDAQRIAHCLRKLLSGKSVNFETEYACHSPEENHWFLLQANCFQIGEATRVVITHDNVTQLRQAVKDAQAASTIKSQFLATMSHEIRTPMNGVLGMLHLLNKTDLNVRQQHYLKTATNSGEMLLAVINDILDISKLEANKVELESIPFDPVELVEETAALMAKGAYEKNLELICSIGPDMPRRVKGDPTRLRQVLTNLISNSIKFTEQGDIVLYVVPLEENLIHFGIRDTGVGIHEEGQQRLFEAFTQADSSHTRKYGGTGLGLAISHRLVHAMGGRLEVASAPGLGTDFGFSLRLETVALETLALETIANDLSLSRKRDVSHLAEQRIIIVDDNSTSGRILRDVLSTWQVLQIEHAESGAEALQRMRAAASAGCPFNIALLDMQMQGMSGTQLAQAIREDKILRHMRLVMLSPVHCDDPGPELDACLTKPVRQSDLYNTLHTLLRESVSSQTAAATSDTTDWHFAGRLLLVEDNDINQEVAREILSEAGFTIDTRQNGVEAVQAVQQQNYDAVLMDIQMPVMDGLKATRRIREMGGGFTQLPIIAMTAHALSGDAEKSTTAGMNAHITKPLEPQKMFKEISRWIKPQATPAAPASAIKAKPGKDKPEKENTGVPESLPGIDLADGLDRLCGNWEAYRYILLMFRDKQSDAADRLERFIHEEQWEPAERLAHTLKGSGGNLGAMRIYEAAATLEQSCRTRDANAALEKLAVLRIHLEEVVEGLAQLDEFDASAKPCEAEPSIADLSDCAETIDDLLQRMLHHLDSDLGEAQTCLAALQKQTAGSQLSASVADLQRALNNFDTEAAKNVVKTLQQAAQP